MTETPVLGEYVGLVVATGESPTFTGICVCLKTGVDASPGELLAAVPLNRAELYVVGRVIEGQYIDEYQSAHAVHMLEMLKVKSVSAEHEELPGKFKLAYLDVIEEVDCRNGNLVVHEPHALVPPGSKVYRVGPEVARAVLGLSSDDVTSLNVGTLLGEEGAPIPLDPRRVLPRHILVVGTTGTGKTWLRGVLAEELQRLGIPQVHIDVHGEFIEATKELNGLNLVPGRDATVRLTSLSEPEALELIPYLTDLQAEIVRRAFLDLKSGKRSKQKTLVEDAVTELLSLVREAGKLMHARNETIEMAEARTATLSYVKIIGPGVDWARLLKENRILNLDCRFLAHSELQAVVGAVARELLELRMKKAVRPLVFFVDEAHLFIPYGEDVPAAHVLREVIRYGRHYGLGLVLVTPSPFDIDQRVTRITNTRFIFAIEPDQLRALRGVFADAPRDMIQRLPKMEVGTCLLTGSRETVRHALPIHVRGRKTTHGGEAPDFLQEESSG